MSSRTHLLMRSGVCWGSNVSLAATALLGCFILASLNRPSQSLATPPPSGGGGEWMWLDRAIRYERWHPPLILHGNSFSSRGSSWSPAIIASGRNVFSDTTYSPDGTIVVRSFDFWQFDFWQAAECAAVLAVVLAMARWRLHRDLPGPPGVCRTCGYDLRASTDRCPECGTSILVEAKA